MACGGKADAWAKQVQDIDEVKVLRQGAEKGDAEAMRSLGHAYRDGKFGLETDPLKANMFVKQGGCLVLLQDQ